MNLAHVLNVRRLMEESQSKDDAYIAIMHILDGQIANAVDKLQPLNEMEIEVLKTNSVVDAIKLYRTRTGALLVEGKVMCDNYRARHHC
jgi:ribosomal protein L7/L12